MRRLILTALLFAGFLSIPKAATLAAEPIRVVIWDEQQPSQRQAYPEFLGDYIAAYLKKQPGLKSRRFRFLQRERVAISIAPVLLPNRVSKTDQRMTSVSTSSISKY